jgi:hypothetical protein
MALAQDALEEELRSLLQKRLKKRGYREFDAKIGKAGSGWTSKFLRGERTLTLDTFLVVCGALETHPATLLEGAYPRSQREAEEVRAIAEYLPLGEAEVRRIVAEELEKEKEGRRRSGDSALE